MQFCITRSIIFLYLWNKGWSVGRANMTKNNINLFMFSDSIEYLSLLWVLKWIWILKIEDYIKILNCFLVKNVLQNTSLKIFKDYFTKSEETHNHNTRHSSRNTVKRQHSSTRQYGQHSVKNQAATTWNQLQNALNIDMHNETSSKVKKNLKSYFVNTYQTPTEWMLYIFLFTA